MSEASAWGGRAERARRVTILELLDGGARALYFFVPSERWCHAADKALSIGIGSFGTPIVHPGRGP